MEAAKWHLEPISEADFLLAVRVSPEPTTWYKMPDLSLLWCGETVPRRFEARALDWRIGQSRPGARRGVREAVGRGSHARPTRVTSVARALKAGKVLDMSAAGLP